MAQNEQRQANNSDGLIEKLVGIRRVAKVVKVVAFSVSLH